VNDEKLLNARDNLYARMASRLIRALIPFLGTKADPKIVATVSRPYVIAARQQAQNIAYQDYVKFVQNQNPIPKMEQNRFTNELWQGSIDKALTAMPLFGSAQVQDITMSADYWARDAEWGQRVDVAKKDKRIDKVARVDFEPPTCPFCTLLNSRGAVYLSAESAMRTLHNGDTCTCVFVASGQTDYPGSANTKLAEDRYKKAVKALGTRANTTTILKELAAQSPNRPEGRVQAHVKQEIGTVTSGKITDTKARIATLEKLNPKSDAAVKYRDEQLARNHDVLKALEGNP
jgi:hypothetical protein